MVDGSDAQRVAGSKRANRPSDRRHHADADRAEIATTRAQVTTTEVIKLDGSESKVSNGTATARWDGPALVVESVRDIQGVSVTTRESRSLDAGGAEMSVDTVVEVQHGYTLKGAKNYGTGKDVYTRVRPR